MKHVTQATGLLITTLFVTGLAAAPVHTSKQPLRVPAALDELQSTEVKMNKQISLRRGYVRDDEGYKKQADKILAEYNKKLAAAKQKIAEYSAKPQAKINQIAEEYKNLCDPARVGKLHDRASYDRCKSLKTSDEARMQDIKNEADAWAKKQADKFNHTVKAGTDAKLAALNVHRNRFSKLFNKARDRLNALQARDKKLRSFITAHPKQVAGECRKPGKAVKKWCSNITWDSAGMHLKPVPSFRYSGTMQF